MVALKERWIKESVRGRFDLGLGHSWVTGLVADDSFASNQSQCGCAVLMNACSRSFLWQTLTRHRNPFPFHKLHCALLSSISNPVMDPPVHSYNSRIHITTTTVRGRWWWISVSDDRFAKPATIGNLMRNVTLVVHYRHISWIMFLGRLLLLHHRIY